MQPTSRRGSGDRGDGGYGRGDVDLGDGDGRPYVIRRRQSGRKHIG